MEVHVSLVGRKDLAGEIYRQLRRAILDGRLPPGGRLPATRELARRLSVSRTTVMVAYDRLTGEGFVTARTGAGTFVSNAVPAPANPARPAGGALRPQPVWDGVAVCAGTFVGEAAAGHLRLPSRRPRRPAVPLPALAAAAGPAAAPGRRGQRRLR